MALSSPHNISYIRTIISNTEKPEDPVSRRKLLEEITGYLEKGAQLSVDERGRYNESLAHAAARLDFPELTKYLIDNSAEVVESTDDFGQSPWHTAAIFGSVGVLKEHHVAGHDITSRCPHSLWSILHLAALKNQTEFLRYVLENELLTVDHKDHYGRTPLFVAIQYQKREATYLLLKFGADQTEKSKLKITPSGLSSYFMPELAIRFLDEIQKCTGILDDEESDIPAENFLKFSQSKDLSIILVSPKCNELIVHPVIKRLIKSVYFTNLKGMITFTIWFLLDILSISFLCMVEQIEIPTLMKNKANNLVELVLVIISVIWIGICATYKLGKFTAFIKLSLQDHRSDGSGQLIDCSKRCNNERTKEDISEFVHFHKQLKRSKIDRLWKESYWTVKGTIARVCVISLSLHEGAHIHVRNYTTFVATLVIFLDVLFHDGNDICYLPNSLMITLLSMKEALSSFVKNLITILMLAMPYLLITLKFTYKEKHYFTNIEQNEGHKHQDEVQTLPAIGWSLLYMFKVMLTDDYQVEYFNVKHPEFFLIYHICIVFLLSLVVMNLIIAQTSQTHEDYTDNSKAEILKHRIFTIILFGMFKRAEDAYEAKHDVHS